MVLICANSSHEHWFDCPEFVRAYYQADSTSLKHGLDALECANMDILSNMHVYSLQLKRIPSFAVILFNIPSSPNHKTLNPTP